MLSIMQLSNGLLYRLVQKEEEEEEEENRFSIYVLIEHTTPNQ
jgi:hypothetical protein